MTPRFSRQDARLVTVSRLPRHSIGATGSAPRAAHSRKAGSFFGTFETSRNVRYPVAIGGESGVRRETGKE